MVTFIWVSLLLVIASIIGLLFRIFRSPSLPDRLIALDAISVTFISSTALLSVLFGTKFFMEVILLLAIISFIGTIAFAKFIEKGTIVEYDRHS
ncbi:monovalent cation/H+ antiporter complex subunit F [Lentibacillus sp. N15]|uniref:monovalent cation/H+ antiporter complex subunit F n=1 Tax=Lentibacillus songyuanensis TaxID=3136161 RepID=UPI0031BB4A08